KSCEPSRERALLWTIAAMSALPADLARASSSASPRVSILAVDDLPANLVAIEAIVDALGHDVVAVRSGVAPLSAAATREFAAIVLDVTMPGLDGFETLARLRKLATARAT